MTLVDEDVSILRHEVLTGLRFCRSMGCLAPTETGSSESLPQCRFMGNYFACFVTLSGLATTVRQRSSTLNVSIN
jgi:hypothetical protein